MLLYSGEENWLKFIICDSKFSLAINAVFIPLMLYAVVV